MKYPLQPRALVLSIAAFAILAVKANAGIVIQFEEIGGNVVATATGSMVVPNTLVGSISGSGNTISIDSRLLHWPGSTALYYNGGVNSGFTLNALHGESLGSAGATGNTFGVEGANIFFDSTGSPGSTYTPTSIWTWVSTDLDAIGQGDLTSTPKVIYTASNGETVSFALVPEPSTSLLLGGVLLVSLRRKRG